MPAGGAHVYDININLQHSQIAINSRRGKGGSKGIDIGYVFSIQSFADNGLVGSEKFKDEVQIGQASTPSSRS